MQATKALARVVNATVRVDGKNGHGQGVLVSGGFILTATHCIEIDYRMFLGATYVVNVTTKNGVRLRVEPLAADPISDIAVLGSLDPQESEESYDDSEKFEQWCKATPAVPLATTLPAFRAPLPVHILAHEGKWIGARIIRYEPWHPPSGRIGIEAEDRIEDGTSGGPVVDSSGRLVGLVSWFTEVKAGEQSKGALPHPHLALPRWAWAQIIAAEKKSDPEKFL